MDGQGRTLDESRAGWIKGKASTSRSPSRVHVTSRLRGVEEEGEMVTAKGIDATCAHSIAWPHAELPAKESQGALEESHVVEHVMQARYAQVRRRVPVPPPEQQTMACHVIPLPLPAFAFPSPSCCCAAATDWSRRMTEQAAHLSCCITETAFVRRAS
jgi:hypothetical protein